MSALVEFLQHQLEQVKLLAVRETRAAYESGRKEGYAAGYAAALSELGRLSAAEKNELGSADPVQ